MYRAFVIGLLLLLAATSFAARPWTIEDDLNWDGIPVENSAQFSVETLGIGHLRIHFSDPQVLSEQVSLEKRVWTLFNIPGETRKWEAGKPQVPVVARAVRMPDRGKVELRITNAQYTELTGVDVFPQQANAIGNDAEKRYDAAPFAYDEACYSSDNWFPGDLARISTPSIVRDARVAVLGMQPVQVNPAMRTVRIYSSIDIEIVPSGGMGENELLYAPGPVPSFAAIYSEIIGADDLVDEAVNAQPGQILVITPTAALGIAQQWANWKKATGRPTQIISYSTRPTNTTVYNAVLNAYNTWNPPLEMVQVFGDDDQITQGGPVGGGSSDHMYSQLSPNSTDILGDISVGRFSYTSGSATELQLMLNRTLGYEKTPWMGAGGTDTTWYYRAFGYCGVSHSLTSNRPVVRFCQNMVRQRGGTIFPYAEHNGQVSTADINTNLSPGATHWIHRAGYIGEISNASVSGINNGNKCFVAFNITCGTGNWGGAGAGAIAEALTRLGSPTEPKGAIAAVSTATSGTAPQYNNVIAAGLYQGFGVLEQTMPAPMLFTGKFHLWRNFILDKSAEVTSFSGWNNLMGDGSAKIWTARPINLEANLAAQISLGQNRLEFTVTNSRGPAANVLVTAFKTSAGGNQETYYRTRTDSSGHVVLPLTNASVGNLVVTAFGDKVGQNYIPFVDTILVTNASTDFGFSGLTFDDDNTGGTVGNGNHAPSPGETIDLGITIASRGTTGSVSGLSGTLSSNDPRIVVTNATQSWRTLALNDSAESNAPFRIQLLAGLRHNETVNLSLRMTAADTLLNRTLAVPLTIQSLRGQYVSSATVNASGQATPFTPGSTVRLTVSVQNNGGLSTGLTNATLFSQNQYLTVNTSESSYDSLPVGATIVTPANRRFVISAHAMTVPGTQANVGLILQAGSASDTIFFTIDIGTRRTIDPTGPDAYGYVAYDQSDTTYEVHPTYQWQELVPALGGTGTRLANMDDGGETQDRYVHIRLPFPVQYYGNTFDSITVCTNGWFAFGAQQYYDNFRNWHLPAQEGPRNMVAVFWDELVTTGGNNGVYVKNDTANHTFIISWVTRTTFGTQAANEFQCIIYDENFLPSFTGDAALKFQYKTFNNITGDYHDTDYATIGIADGTYTRALEYSYYNRFTPGSAPITNGTNVNRAIMFTTLANLITGRLTGTVTRVDNGQPVSGATVFIPSGGYSTLTDSLGHYAIERVMIGSYPVRAGKLGYNDTIRSTEIFEDSTSVLDFALREPRFQQTVVNGDSAAANVVYAEVDALSTNRVNRTIRLYNPGNGTLTWDATLLYSLTGTETDAAVRGPVRPELPAIDETDSAWDLMYSFNASSAITPADIGMQGVEFDGNNFWVSGSNGTMNPNKLYKFSRTGQLIDSYNQPDTISSIGYRDLAFDGNNLYGSSARSIDVVDRTGNLVRSLPSPFNPARALAIDTAAGLLYACDRVSNISVIRLTDGVVVRELSNPGIDIYGLAWNPGDENGQFLYAHTRNGTSYRGSIVYKFDPISGSNSMVHTLSNSRWDAYGATVTNSFNPLFWSFVALQNDSANAQDRVSLYEISFNRTWVNFAPASGIIAAGDSADITVTLWASTLPGGDYRVAINLNSNAVPGNSQVPVHLHVIDTSTPEEPVVSVPQKFELEQNFPNPFNPTTSISFALPKSANVSLAVYDALGREVATLLNGASFTAGKHTVRFDGTSMSSGVYFVRMDAAGYSATRKMILMK